MALKALALNCSLKRPTSEEPSSTALMLSLITDRLQGLGVTSDTVWLTEHEIKPGVSADEGDGDEWPAIRRKVLDADILVVATPIWMGQPSSVCKRALERLDAFLGETDEGGRMPTFGKVCLVGVVGNEDGAHHVSAELYQALNDVGYSIPPNAVAYWVGEAMQSTNFVDLSEVPEKVSSTIAMAASNAAHLARLLKENGYPPPG